MSRHEAESLTEFAWARAGRYEPELIPVTDEEAWVFFTDTVESKNPPPVTQDVFGYLQNGIGWQGMPLPFEIESVLHGWLEFEGNDKEKSVQALP